MLVLAVWMRRFVAVLLCRLAAADFDVSVCVCRASGKFLALGARKALNQKQTSLLFSSQLCLQDGLIFLTDDKCYFDFLLWRFYSF